MPLSKIGERHQVVIPKEIFEKLKLKPGEYLDVQFKDQTVVMKPTKITLRNTKISPKEIYRNIKRVWLKKGWAKADDPDLDEKIAERVKAVIQKDQEWFWTDEWQDEEREADEDAKKRGSKTFRDVEDLIRELNS